MHITYRARGRMLALLIVLSLAAGGDSRVLGYDETTRSYFPKPAPPTRLYVIREADMTTAQETMIATLQGVIAKTRPEIYVIPGGRPSYNTWLTQLKNEYGVTTTSISDAWQLIGAFKPRLTGYILYKSGNSSINVATSLAGIKNAVAVEESIESAAKARGLSRVMDVRLRDEAWLRTNYWSQLRHDVLFEQKESAPYHNQLRDYAAMARGMIFYDGNSQFRNDALAGMDPDSVLLGWGDTTAGEDTVVAPAARRGVSILPADHAYNLSTLSGITENTLVQRTHVPTPAAEPNVHYVTFLMSDGDNLQWLLGDFTGPKWFGSARRGSFNMGWGITPSLIDLAPSVLKWYYGNASAGTHKDHFVAAPSGAGYTYPSMYPAAEVDLNAQRLNGYLGRADLGLLQVIDFNSFDNMVLWDRYTRQPNIRGMFYLEYADYSMHRGKINWSNDKPIITPRARLWAGLPGADEASVTATINSAARNPKSAGGYSVVLVHSWSKTLDNVQTVIGGLAPDVRVVTPEVLVQLIKANTSPPNASFTFSGGAEGWAGATGGKQYDRAAWNGSVGNPAGALQLDGSDLGVPDTRPNAWFSRQVALPQTARTLRFETRSADATHDGNLRVRLVDDAGSRTLLDWETVRGESWVGRSADISAHAGKTVTIFFEQNDSGQGAGETRYVDNVRIDVAAP